MGVYEHPPDPEDREAALRLALGWDTVGGQDVATSVMLDDFLSRMDHLAEAAEAGNSQPLANLYEDLYGILYLTMPVDPDDRDLPHPDEVHP